MSFIHDSLSDPGVARKKDSGFRIIIVGGSIAGLTLAHCLDKAVIEYIVLERSDNILSQAGASIGILPNGARILDQLGLYDAVESEIEPLDRSHIYFPDEFGFTSNFPTILNERHGYPLSFLARRRFLEIMFTSMADRSRVHFGKEVLRVDKLKHEMQVITSDGSSYQGDLVVGADGVHSRIRSEMWRIAHSISPGLISHVEKNAMYAEYLCVYGISSAISGLVVGEQITRFYNRLTILTFHGKEGRIFWLVLRKMDRKYYYPQIPRFTSVDMEQICLQLHEYNIWKGVKFRQIWNQREVCSMTAVEENVFQTWCFGQIVCLGDSVHKMTPNFGQGANSAIESAAALANTLHNLKKAHDVRLLSTSEIGTALNTFANSRLNRTSSMVKTAAFVTRLQARDGWINQVIGRYCAPYLGDLPADMSSSVLMGASRVDYVPLPPRSKTTYTESRMRAVWTSRVISIVAICMFTAITVRISISAIDS